MANNNNKHMKIYKEAWNIGEQDFKMCEFNGCNNIICEVHHIEYRSSFGKKRKEEQDDFSNLIGVCRIHHDLIHD